MKLTGTNKPITYTTHPFHKACSRSLCGSQPTNPPRFTGQEQKHHSTTTPSGNNTRRHGKTVYNKKEVVQHKNTQPATHPRKGVGNKVTVVIAWGKRPVPFRTRKLRPTAPMVLHSRGCGRVGHRRTTPKTGRGPTPHGAGPPCINTHKPPPTTPQFTQWPPYRAATLR